MLNVSISTDSDTDAGSSPLRIEQEFREFFRPKQEELDHVETEEEHKLICKNFRVSVNLTKFNCLFDFFKYWRNRGSFKKRDSKQCLELIMKAYERYKNCPRRMWGEDVIEGRLNEERKIRKAIFVRYIKEHKAKELASEQTSNESVHTQSNLSEEEINVFDTESESESSLPSFIVEHELAFDGLCAPPQSQPDETNGESANSLAKLQNEFVDILYSEEMCEKGTEDLAQSVNESQSSQLTTETFYGGTQITSTQNSEQSPKKKKPKTF